MRSALVDEEGPVLEGLATGLDIAARAQDLAASIKLKREMLRREEQARSHRIRSTGRTSSC